MSSNVGLSTPRGSGTSGYVQRNMSFLRPRDNPPRDPEQTLKYRQRAPDADILAHDRKREVEVQCLKLQDQLEDDGCFFSWSQRVGWEWWLTVDRAGAKGWKRTRLRSAWMHCARSYWPRWRAARAASMRVRSSHTRCTSLLLPKWVCPPLPLSLFGCEG